MRRPVRKCKTLSVHEILPKVVTPLLKSHDVKGVGLLYDWKKIVGAPLCDLTKPEKVTYKRGAIAGGTLHLNISPAIALELQHTQDQLVDKINTYFGYKSIADLKLKQTHFQTKIKAEKTLSPAEKSKIQAATREVTDETLSTSLQSLGEAMALKG